MKIIHQLDRVILGKDLPEHGLERGDILWRVSSIFLQ